MPVILVFAKCSNNFKYLICSIHSKYIYVHIYVQLLYKIWNMLKLLIGEH